MCHDSAVIHHRVPVRANLTILIVVDNALVALIDVVLATVVHAAILERILSPIIIGGTPTGKVQLVALGIIVGEFARVLVAWMRSHTVLDEHVLTVSPQSEEVLSRAGDGLTAAGLTSELQIHTILGSKVDLVPGVGVRPLFFDVRLACPYC